MWTQHPQHVCDGLHVCGSPSDPSGGEGSGLEVRTGYLELVRCNNSSMEEHVHKMSHLSWTLLWE